MPILSSAKKALRQTKRKTAFNRPVKSRAKTMVDAMKKAPTLEALSNAFSAIDRAVKRHIFHKNKAARMKSQLSKLMAVAKK
jgi:small subunit ribosomal protein S20